MRVRLLAIALVSLGVGAGSAPGQGAPAAPLLLEVGIEGTGGVTWTSGPVLGESFGRLRAIGREGSWVLMLARAEVATDDPNDQQKLAELLARRPWLAPMRMAATAISPSLAGAPDLHIDPALALSLLVPCALPVASTGLVADGVRLVAQPVLDQDEDGPLLEHPVEWAADAAGQALWLPSLDAAWSALLDDPDTTGPKTKFIFFSLMQQAVWLQAPSTEAAKEFLDGPDLFLAIDIGLTLQIQALSVRDLSPSLDVTIDPDTSPGLPGLDLTPPISPELNVSSPVQVHVLPGLPITAPAPGGSPLVGVLGQAMAFPLGRLVQPARATFTEAGTGAPLIANLHFVRPGYVAVRVPAGAAAGSIEIANAYGSIQRAFQASPPP